MKSFLNSVSGSNTLPTGKNETTVGFSKTTLFDILLKDKKQQINLDKKHSKKNKKFMFVQNSVSVS